jgi:concanavalin A-like lectin/glucanase superfamily protein
MSVKIVILLITSFVLFTLLTSIPADENKISNQGLIAYYGFDEGNGEILHDLSGNNHDGTIVEGSWTDGISGKALDFNGINTYVNLPPSTLGNWNSLTYSFWVKAPKYSGSGWPAFFGSHTTSLTYNTCIAISRNTETLHIEIDTDTGNYETNGNITIPWDTWFHAALVYDGSNLTEYINGVRGKSIPATGNLKNVAELNIGQLGNGRYFFNGLIDEAYIFNRALSAVEIKQLYNHAVTYSSSIFFKENNAIEQSPLNTILPRETVPLAATIITVTTIGLWQLFGSIIIEFLSDYSSERIIESKETKKNLSSRLDKFRIPYIPLSTTELFHIFIAVVVFSIALSWTWGTSIDEILSLFLLNIVIIGFIYICRELLRVHYSSKLNIQTYHVLWPFGAILTIASSFLGNTFSLASYNTAENEDDGRYAQMLFQSNIIFYIVAAIIFVINFMVSHVVFQMIFIFLIMTLTIDMTPLKPMDGDIIRKWNAKKWMSLYLIILVSYVFMIFII